jgi:NADH-quinone oxidoreductase subunit C
MSRLDMVVERAEAEGLSVQKAFGSTWVVVPRGELKERLAAWKEAGFTYCAQLLAIDYLTYPEPMPERFGLVYELVSLPGWKEGDGSRFFAKTFVPEGVAVPSAVDLWPGLEWFEREVYDLFGIVFEGHPDLRKILTPEDFEGHPLRKDFPLGETPTLFREGRFIDPEAFRAGLSGLQSGLTGWRGGARKGFRELQEER